MLLDRDDVRAALVEHVSALQARDLDRFAATLGDDVTVVDGRGAILVGRDEVLRSHAAWFAVPQRWSFDYEIRLLREFDGAAIALLEVAYRDAPLAEAARFVLSLLFERDAAGAWKFVFDQNTGLGG